MILSVVDSPSELLDFANRMGEKPALFSLRTTVETCARNQAPFLSTKAAFAETENATYFFLLIDFKGASHTISDLFFGFTGRFNSYDFRKAASDFLKISGLTQNPRSFITCGCADTYGLMTDVILTTLPRAKFSDVYACFLINEAELSEEDLFNMPVDELPEGYTYDVLKPSEADHVAHQWARYREGAEELMKHYIKHMPNVAIRYHGKLAAFQMRSESGIGSHLWVDPEHRGKQLYKGVVRELTRKTYRFGIRRPHSYIRQTNHTMANLLEDQYFCKNENVERLHMYRTTITMNPEDKKLSKL